MYEQPIISAKDALGIIEQTKPSVYKLLDDLVRFGILVEKNIVSKSKSYVLDEYLQLFK
jgi:hypothetical protein